MNDKEQLYGVVLALVQQDPTLGHRRLRTEVATIFGNPISRHEADKLLAKAREEIRQKLLTENNFSAAAQIPEPLGQDWSQYPSIPAGVLVMADPHVPLHDPRWIEYITKTAHAAGIGNLLIAGDWFDAKNLGKYGVEPGYTFDDELGVGDKLASWLLGQFDRIDVIPGNHDARVSRKTEKQLSPQKLMSYQFQGKARTYDHHQCFVGEGWFVLHPGNYSSVALKPAMDFAPIYPGKNIAVAHTHKTGIARDKSGQFWMVETGCSADPRRFAYVHIERKPLPQPTQGALLISKDEKPKLLSPDLM